jgi:hypothetical protein
LDFVAQQAIRQMLKRRYPAPARGYFWDALAQLHMYELRGPLSWRRLAEALESAAELLPARPPFVLFTDRLAGWRRVPKQRRRSPIRVGSLAEGFAIIREHSHSRDGTTREDNYYLCDRSLRWFMAFCHHGGWHLCLPKRAATQRPWRRWRTRVQASAETPSTDI